MQCVCVCVCVCVVCVCVWERERERERERECRLSECNTDCLVALQLSGLGTRVSGVICRAEQGKVLYILGRSINAGSLRLQITIRLKYRMVRNSCDARVRHKI